MSAGGDKRAVTGKLYNYRTPRALIHWIEDELGIKFDLDAAADADNAICPRFFTEEDNALVQEWTGNVWLNPPYGKYLKAFMEKCKEEWRKGNFEYLAALVPDSGDTQWYNDALKGAWQVWRLKHRVAFEFPPENGRIKKSSNTHGSAIFIWKGYDGFPDVDAEILMKEWATRPNGRRK